jgi:hypothetical protein
MRGLNMGTRTVYVPGRATDTTVIQEDTISDKLKLFFLAAALFLGLLVFWGLKQSPPPSMNEYGSPLNEGKTGGAIVQPAPGFGSHETGSEQGVKQLQ